MSNHLISMAYKPTYRRTGSDWKRKARAMLIARDGASCASCGVAETTRWRRQGEFGGWGGDGRYTKVAPCSTLVIDHVRSLADGGDNGMQNLQLLCDQCHLAKTVAEKRSRRAIK
jgi:5-methylcytosine-specific restriction endonuclease McrA